jgi:hypothetical protein
LLYIHFLTTSHANGLILLQRLLPFRYDKLPTSTSTRLVQIESGTGSSPIRISLWHVDLESEPVYNALSYTWQFDGDQWQRQLARFRNERPSRVIQCNGKRLNIMPNLYNALLQVRQIRCDMQIWIDAVCINQSDIDERNNQVNMMQRIYGGALSVFVWLGKSTWNSKRGLEFIQTLPNCPPDGLYLDSNATCSPKVCPYSRREICWATYYTVNELFARSWFHRTWVIQEVILARDIEFWLGRHCIDPGTIQNGLRWVKEATLVVQRNSDRVSVASVGYWWRTRFQGCILMLETRRQYQRCQEQDKLMAFEDALKLSRGCLVSDPRDKIFGILSISKDRNTVVPKIDYRKPAVEIYIDCVMSLMNGLTGVYTLSLVDSTSKCGYVPGMRKNKPNMVPGLHEWPAFPTHIPDLPSWCLDFTRIPRPQPFRDLCGDNFSASSSLRPTFNFLHGGRTLQIRGVIWDVIADTAEDYTGFTKPARRFSDAYFLRLILNIGPRYEPTGELTIEAFWRTIIADTTAEGQHPAPVSMASCFAEWLYYWFDDIIQFRDLPLYRRFFFFFLVAKGRDQPHATERGELDEC